MRYFSDAQYESLVKVEFKLVLLDTGMIFKYHIKMKKTSCIFMFFTDNLGLDV